MAYVTTDKEMIFDMWLTKKLEEKGIKKTWVAQELNVRYQTFAGYGKKCNMPLPILIEMCILLDISLDELKYIDCDYIKLGKIKHKI